MTEDLDDLEVDEADLIICDLIELLKTYRLGVNAAVEMTTERMVELYPEIKPKPAVH